MPTDDDRRVPRYCHEMSDRTHLRGFASMTPERRAEISRKGGLSVPAQHRSFSRDRALASEAGRKGGQNGRRKP